MRTVKITNENDYASLLSELKLHSPIKECARLTWSSYDSLALFISNRELNVCDKD